MHRLHVRFHTHPTDFAKVCQGIHYDTIADTILGVSKTVKHSSFTGHQQASPSA